MLYELNDDRVLSVVPITIKLLLFLSQYMKALNYYSTIFVDSSFVESTSASRTIPLEFLMCIQTFKPGCNMLV